MTNELDKIFDIKHFNRLGNVAVLYIITCNDNGVIKNLEYFACKVQAYLELQAYKHLFPNEHIYVSQSYIKLNF